MSRCSPPDAFEGRLTGTIGIQQAAEHIVAELEAIGAEPLPGSDGYRLGFQLHRQRATDGGDQSAGHRRRRRGADLGGRRVGPGALLLGVGRAVTGPLVFAGYGLVVPETDGFSYDSYATIDVTDKIVVVLRYFPEDSEGGPACAVFPLFVSAVQSAVPRGSGARTGMIVVIGPRSPNAGALVRMTADTGPSPIPA